MSELERKARAAWVAWGEFALFTTCWSCGLMRYCRGRERDRMHCVDCFDLYVRKS